MNKEVSIGERVEILAGPYAGAMGIVEDISTDTGYSHLVYGRRGEWSLGWYRPQDLQPLEES
jgi:hypothetical protein